MPRQAQQNLDNLPNLDNLLLVEWPWKLPWYLDFPKRFRWPYSLSAFPNKHFWHHIRIPTYLFQTLTRPGLVLPEPRDPHARVARVSGAVGGMAAMVEGRHGMVMMEIQVPRRRSAAFTRMEKIDGKIWKCKKRYMCWVVWKWRLFCFCLFPCSQQLTWQ